MAKPKPPPAAPDLPPGPWTYEQALAVISDQLTVTDLPPTALQDLRQALATHPGLWKLTGDIANQAQYLLVTKYTVQPVVQQSIIAGLEAIRRKLGWDQAPMLERLLIDQILTCWLNVYDVQARYTLAHSQNNLSLALGEYWEKRLSAAQRRYLRACEALARVRRLALPALQVNIGDKQVNVAGGALPPGAPPPAAAPRGETVDAQAVPRAEHQRGEHSPPAAE